MDDPLSDRLVDLSLQDDNEAPLLRSAPADAAHDCDPEPEDHITMRCHGVGGEDDPLLSLSVLLVNMSPHRCEVTPDGTQEELVCSIRPFTVRAVAVGTDGAPVVDDKKIVVRASLVYAEDGEPVPTTKGEAPLSGEVDVKQLVNGEATFRLRATALSHHHGRRAFAIRVDAQPSAATPWTTTTNRPCLGFSSPFFSRARLPDQSKAICHGHGHSLALDAARIPPRGPQATAMSGAACRRVALPVVDGEEDGFEDEQPAGRPWPSTEALHAMFPSTLVGIMQEQNEALRIALAEQRQLLSELATLQAGPSGCPPASTPSQLCV